jgi:hypothetical protein
MDMLIKVTAIWEYTYTKDRPRCPRGLSVGLRPLACWDWGFESCWGHGYLSVVFCVLLGRGLCVGLIPRPGESYRLWCVWVWLWSLDSEEPSAHWGLSHHYKEMYTGAPGRRHDFRYEPSALQCMRLWFRNLVRCRADIMSVVFFPPSHAALYTAA